MDSELEAALDRLLDATFDWQASVSPLSAGEVAVIVDAARKVANPDYEAAVSVMWDREPYLESKEENMRRAVDAALGITE